jgi:hypothetical protein
MAKMSHQEIAYKKPETSRKVIMLPAGAGMNTNFRNPIYKRIGSVVGNREQIAIFDDDHFVSVSQVGSNRLGYDSSTTSNRQATVYKEDN